MKKLILLLVIVLADCCLLSCSKKENTSYVLDLSNYDEYKNEQYIIDYKRFDIDNDGIIEDCYITFGPTSGIFTFLITALVDENVKYRDLFTDDHSNVSFFENDGITELKMVKWDFVNDEQYIEYYKIYVNKKRIFLEKIMY